MLSHTLFTRCALAPAFVLLAFARLAMAWPVYTTETVDMSNAVAGKATWFNVGLGACGYTDSNTDWIVALNIEQWESTPGPGAYCNRFLVVKNAQNGATAVAKVRDMCPGCAYGSLDMSPDLFKAISTGGLDEGVYPIQWSWLPTDYVPAGY